MGTGGPVRRIDGRWTVPVTSRMMRPTAPVASWMPPKLAVPPTSGSVQALAVQPEPAVMLTWAGTLAVTFQALRVTESVLFGITVPVVSWRATATVWLSAWPDNREVGAEVIFSWLGRMKITSGAVICATPGKSVVKVSR